MKKFNLLLLSMVLFTCSVFAQIKYDIKDTEQLVKKGFQVILPGSSVKDAEASIKDFLKAYKPKIDYADKTKSEWLASQAIMPTLNAAPVDVYFNVQPSGNDAVLYLFFNLGNSYVSAGIPDKYAAAIAFSFLIGQMSGPLVKALDEKNILARTLFLATGVFVGMVLVGLYDKNNMLGFGPYLLGALLGLIIAQLILFALEATSAIKKQQYFQGAKVLSFFGIGLFSLFAAYDTQVVKMHARTCKKQGDYIEESTGLFLDFVNLFQKIGVVGLLEDN
jgi:FtsH-binding integral membrane protein